MATLAVCMIVKNEEKYLASCLQSIRDVASQIVIVDTGSTDRTLKIARQFGAQISHFKWIGDFSAARNESLKQAKSDWILHIDADEVLDSDSADHLPNLLQDTKADAFNITVRNFHPPEDMVQFKDSVQVRLFRNKREFRFQNKIHEQILPSILSRKGSIINSSLRMDHLGYQENNVQKARRNLPLIEAGVRDNPQDPYLLFKLAETYKAVGQTDEAYLSFKKVLKQNPMTISVEILDTLYMRMAQIELSRDRYPEAIHSARQSLEVNPLNDVSLYILGIALIYSGKPEQAELYLEKIKSLENNLSIKSEDVEQLILACRTMKRGG